jgi:hypothetical protein
MEKVRDRFWLWGHEGAAHNEGWGLPVPSRMTAAEAAHYLGTPGVVMVSYGGTPAPPFDQHAMALSSLDRVCWSIIGDSSTKRNDEQSDLDEVIRIAGKYPNTTAAIMDDFFHDKGDDAGRASADQIRTFQQKLHNTQRADGGTGLDLWVVLYSRQLEMDFTQHLECCDIVTFWTWNASQLVDLERNFARLEERAPDTRKILGCYLWDYGDHLPMPVESMKAQAEFGLDALRSGRIEGMIFLSNCVADIGLDAVEWTRDWIAKVGGETL